jgi:hypothetical protein
MKEKRLVIPDQKMTELQIDLGNEDRETVDVRRNFGGSDHRPSLDRHAESPIVMAVERP